tara:strand:- start:5185 stop:5670 length:486 start_codon:yes stop_codon:yes gene_type:complete
MKFLKFFKKRESKSRNFKQNDLSSLKEIGKIVYEARIKKNISIQDLSNSSKIPVYTIKAIENNIKELIPQTPFLKSKLLKLEECLSIRNNKLTNLIEINNNLLTKKEEMNFAPNQFDVRQTFKGSIIYLLILLISIFILNSYYLNNRVIEFKYIEINEKSK